MALGTAASYPLGLWLGQAWLLPILNTATAFALMAGALRRGQRAQAVRQMLAWAALLAVCGTLTFAVWPSPPDTLVLNGPAYREEMFRWIRTGEGREATLAGFLPEHLLHLGLFVVASLATASAASMTMGAVLMNYMSFYVASLFRAGVPASAVVALGWQPWVVSRVAAFTIFGVVLAEPALARLLRYRYSGLSAARRWLYAAAGLILLDWVLKASLAPIWRRLLGHALGG
jgi:hypothetical protein